MFCGIIAKYLSSYSYQNTVLSISFVKIGLALHFKSWTSEENNNYKKIFLCSGKLTLCFQILECSFQFQSRNQKDSSHGVYSFTYLLIQALFQTLQLVQISKVKYTTLSHLLSLLESDDQVAVIDKFQILTYNLKYIQILDVCINLRTGECQMCLQLIVCLQA